MWQPRKLGRILMIGLIVRNAKGRRNVFICGEEGVNYYGVELSILGVYST